MKVGSMFAGIGGFDLGFERSGFEVAWCVEWDKNAQAVLRKRFPKATIYGDIREVDPEKLERVDVVCGGFPCQDLSVAGKRAGLAGERSGLFHDAMRIVRRLRPSILILENVPGLHSSNRGLDFATVLREVGEGWDCAEVAWRVLDSRYFGVAQRRRRVFVVAGSRIGCAEQVLALAEGVRWHPAARDEAREDAASDAATRARRGVSWDGSDCAATLTKQNENGAQRMPDKGNLGAIVIDRAAFNQGTNAAYDPRIEESPEMSSLVARGPHAVAHAFYYTGGSHGLEPHHGVSPPLKVGSSIGIPSPPAVAYRKSRRAQSVDDHETWVEDEIANKLNQFDVGDVRTTKIICQQTISFHPTQDPISTINGPTHALGCGSSQGCATVAVAIEMQVRRLTPVECERLQGFPDGWTDIGTPEKPTADTHRYKQLGNAVTVNVAEWIARRTMNHLTGETR